MPNTIPAGLPNQIESLSTQVLSYALPLAAIATITMALLEMIKALTRARMFYHRGTIRRWISGDAYADLIFLTVSDAKSENALFDQQTEKMMGQIQSAATVALDFPQVYPSLYRFLTEPGVVPRGTSADEAGATSQRHADVKTWLEYAPKLEKDRPQDQRDQLPGGGQAAMRARARLDHSVTRKLDALQIRTLYLWARANQLVSVVGSGVLILALLDDPDPARKIVLAAAGGMVAPFAKDVVTALSGLRTKVS